MCRRKLHFTKDTQNYSKELKLFLDRDILRFQTKQSDSVSCVRQNNIFVL